MPFSNAWLNMTGLGGWWQTSVRLGGRWTPREHDAVCRNAIRIVLNYEVSYRHSSCQNTSLEVCTLGRAVVLYWESTWRAAYIAKKPYIYSNGLECVGCPSLACCPFAPVAVWPRTVGWLCQCRELSQPGKGKKEKGQAFFISVRSLLDRLVREGRDEVVKNINCSIQCFTVLSSKTMIWGYIRQL